MAARRLPPDAAAAVNDQQRAATVAAWAEDASRSAVAATVAEGGAIAVPSAGAPPVQLPLRPTAIVTQHDAVRGTQVTLSIPLDGPAAPAAAPGTAAAGVRQVRPSDPTIAEADTDAGVRPDTPKKKLMRRDSLERREALLKGKEGSRRRQRWENGYLLNNPWAVPPLPSDWEIQPTHPRPAVPYFLAPLWEADASQRARRQSRAARAKARSTLDSRANVLPRELRDKLKRTKSARGLLMDLETQVRHFLEEYYQKQAAIDRMQLDSVIESEGEEAGAGGVPLNKDSGEKKDKKNKNKNKQQSKTSAGDAPAMPATPADSEEDEVVFVGRQGQMKDVPPSPTVKNLNSTNAQAKTSDPRNRSNTVASSSSSRPGTSGTAYTGVTFASDSDEDYNMIEMHPPQGSSLSAPAHSLSLQREKLVFDGPAADQAASFARWIVHSIGDYYGLRTWSVTVSGGSGGAQAARREAYVGIDDEAGEALKRIVALGGVRGGMRSGRLGRGAGQVDKGLVLPRPLWGMV